MADLPLNLRVEDFNSVRDLYVAVKSQLVALDDNPGYQKMDLEDFLDLMKQIDYIFELCVTNNETTDRLFEMSALTTDMVE